MKRAQRLQSARSWLETYEGNKVIRDYRRRYGVAWNDAFVELEMLDVPIDPVYRERVLQSAAAQAAAKRQKRARERARRADVWSEYEDADSALGRAGDCVGCDASTSSAQVMFRPLDDLGLCPVCAAMLERDLLRQRDWEYAASTALLSDGDREALCRQVVAEYGQGLELIAPSRPAKRRHRKDG
jgi:hypothetical protein